MAKLQTTLAPDNSSNAAFRAWGSGLSAALAAMGLTKVETSIDWTTVNAPGAGSTSMGYEVWHFTDALQATAPIFIKIEYGSGSGATIPAIWITSGTARAAGGVVSGNGVARTQLRASANSATLSTCLISGDTNRIAVALWPNSSNCVVFAFERVADEDGNDTAGGYYYLLLGQAAGVSAAQMIPFTGSAAGNSSIWCLSNNVSGVYGSSTASYDIRPNRGGFLFPPSPNLVGYYIPDIGAGVLNVVTFTMYGASSSFMSLGSMPSNVSISVSTNAGLMIRWED